MFIHMSATLAPERVDVLLDAALAAFDALGYGATPVPVIAQHAGVAVGSLYRYFPGKEQLANALFQREKRRMAAALFDGVVLDGPAADVFRNVWARLGAFAAEHPAALCFLELHHHDAYLDDESRAVAAGVDDTVARLLRRWQRRGEVRKGDPALLMAQVFGGFVGVVRQQRATGRSLTARLGELTCEPAWNLLAAPSKGTSR
jgi:AcrR family transcriptional regulator